MKKPVVRDFYLVNLIKTLSGTLLYAFISAVLGVIFWVVILPFSDFFPIFTTSVVIGGLLSLYGILGILEISPGGRVLVGVSYWFGATLWTYPAGLLLAFGKPSEVGTDYVSGLLVALGIYFFLIEIFPKIKRLFKK